jgi:hypothetical protein
MWCTLQAEQIKRLLTPGNKRKEGSPSLAQPSEKQSVDVKEANVAPLPLETTVSDLDLPYIDQAITFHHQAIELLQLQKQKRLNFHVSTSTSYSLPPPIPMNQYPTPPHASPPSLSPEMKEIILRARCGTVQVN